MKLGFTRLILPLLFALIILSSCKKQEGPGGTSNIRGKIIVHDFDKGFQTPVPAKIYGAPDEKVYLIYGDADQTFDDDVNTSYDGTYEFKYLQKGSYHLFVYSKDSTGAKSQTPLSKVKIPVKIDVEISDKGTTVTAPDMIILDDNN
jgi:hypothetical protein